MKSKVRHVGMFDFKETYRILFELLIEKGYDVHEREYKEIMQAAGAKEVDINWDAKKSATGYFQFFITVRFHPVAMTSQEVEIDGVKQKMNKGDLTIEFSCSLVKDYKNAFVKKPFGKLLQKTYDMYIVRERTEQQEIRMIGEYEELLETVKSFLALTAKR